ncbi:hypothetical protein C8A00DRAFT_35139 [Chaetomidium leptoderma]|uniref:AIG2-like protein n=1 Tax=Chaetomidium leptoderma TaxID=669021 RepID=A0AAN6VJV1_9PEZI|nr:hypothetical protein C8A00DRAFT_35139 [Chaetomidium leptoderma]
MDPQHPEKYSHPDDAPQPPTMATQSGAATDEPITKESPPNGTFAFFFYGTLQDPDVLRAAAGLSSPVLGLQDAWIEGRIRGKLWQPGSEGEVGVEHCLRLQAYETHAYEPSDCVVHVGGGGDDEEEVKALVFTWAGDKGSGELSDGVFDLGVWQEKYKAVMFGFGAETRE